MYSVLYLWHVEYIFIKLILVSQIPLPTDPIRIQILNYHPCWIGFAQGQQQLKSHLAVHHCAIHTLYKEVDGLKIEADKWNIDFRQRFVEVGDQLIDFKFADQLTFLQMW